MQTKVSTIPTLSKDSLAYILGGGTMGECLRRYDWSTTSLGHPSKWSVPLRTTVSIVLNSRFPAAVIWGPDLTTIYNDAFRPILGGKPEALGRSFREIWSEVWDSIGPIAERAFAGEATFIENYPLTVTRNGTPERAYFTFCYSPVRDEHGTVVGMIDTVIETTESVLARAAVADMNAHLESLVATRTHELTKTQDALRQSQKMEAIGNLTGGVAHDFNNLLQVISGNLQLLAKDLAGNHPAEQRLRNALAGVSRGSKLASQLLAFGRRQPLAPKVVNPGRLIRNMDDILCRTLGDAIDVETIVADGLWNTLIDPTNVESAVLNLAINARDAMDGQGRLTITAGNTVLDEHDRQAFPEVAPGPYVLLSVTDTGCGMPPETVEKVFEPFFTTKPEGKGTGLGLSMVYGFVKQSGGHVTIHSDPGHGTTVTLYLPRSTRAEDPPETIETGPISGGTETILVAEDDEAVRETVTALLHDLGYRVLTARDAQSALAVLESGVTIDLLFTDMIMPGPLKSTDLARLAQAQRPGLGVLFTSGYTKDAIIHGGQLDPGIELLSKPYSREAMARKIRHALDNRRQRQEAISQPFPAPPAVSPADRQRILLVEDDALIRLATTDLLTHMGYTVFDAGNGTEALTILGRETIDALVTDINLPGMSGYELAAEATKRTPGLAIIMATGYDAVRSADDGDVVVLRKPYDATALARALEASRA